MTKDMIFQEILELKMQNSRDSLIIQKELKKCYSFLETACKVYSPELTESERDLLILQSLQVTHRLASWERSATNLKAGLFHLLLKGRTVKDQNLILRSIRKSIDVSTKEILQQYCKGKRILLQAEARLSEGTSIPEDLFRDISPEVFYLITAHRMEELRNDRKNPSEATKALARATLESLIPEIKRQGAYYLDDQLEELCFMITNRDDYNKVDRYSQNLLNENKYSYEIFRREMADLFSPENQELPEHFQEYQKRIIKITSKHRSFNSMHRFLSRTKKIDDQTTMNVHGLVLYKITLIIKNTVKGEKAQTPAGFFLQFYDALLRENRLHPTFTIHRYVKTIDPRTNVFIISDDSDNFYRLFVNTEDEYQRYLYGDFSLDEKKREHRLEDHHSDDKIKVYKKDGSAEWIPKGATVLDFAFQLHEDLGLNCHYGIVNQSRVPISQRLNGGDHVEIVQFKQGHGKDPELSWFKYANTATAREVLIRHFTNHYNSLYQNSKRDFSVVNQYGVPVRVNTGTTILDFAFQEYGERALTYLQGYTGKERIPRNMDYLVLTNQTISIELDDQVHATLDWFRYVNTDKAKSILIDYFKN